MGPKLIFALLRTKTQLNIILFLFVNLWVIDGLLLVFFNVDCNGFQINIGGISFSNPNSNRD